MADWLLFGPFGAVTMITDYLLMVLVPVTVLFSIIRQVLISSGLIYHLCGSRRSTSSFTWESALPLLTGFGCTTAALCALSSVTSSRERLISSILLCLAIPCAPQIGIIFACFKMLSHVHIFFYIIFMTTVTFLVLTILCRIFPAESNKTESLHMKKTLSFPDLSAIIRNSIREGIVFFRKSLLPFVSAGIVLSLLDYYGIDSALASMLSPFTQGVLMLPGEAASVIIMTLIKRDLGAAGFMSVASPELFTMSQLTSLLILMTLCPPCFASMTALYHQEGIFKASVISVFLLMLSFLCCRVSYCIEHMLLL